MRGMQSRSAAGWCRSCPRAAAIGAGVPVAPDRIGRDRGNRHGEARVLDQNPAARSRVLWWTTKTDHLRAPARRADSCDNAPGCWRLGSVAARVYTPTVNRIDRMYALIEELRAAGRRGRTARQLAEHFEVSVRTIERDLSVLGQAGVPLARKQGQGGGCALDRSMSLPPLNFTPRECPRVLSHQPLPEPSLPNRPSRSISAPASTSTRLDRQPRQPAVADPTSPQPRSRKIEAGDRSCVCAAEVRRSGASGRSTPTVRARQGASSLPVSARRVEAVSTGQRPVARVG
jgi:DNA-binding transcriptional ArsR family regulator